MTIQRARELLGEDIATLSDEEVANLNAQTKAMSREFLKFIIKNKCENNN